MPTAATKRKLPANKKPITKRFRHGGEARQRGQGDAERSGQGRHAGWPRQTQSASRPQQSG